MKKEYLLMIQGALAAAGAFFSDKFGILFPVFCLLLGAMVLDYITGMWASKIEAIEHPDDSGYGWTSKKGAKGIAKKVGYLSAIAVALVVDYVILNVSGEIGIDIPASAFFGLLIAIWYLLNELLSIIENAGRMGADVPEWMRKYIAVLRDTIDKKVE